MSAVENYTGVEEIDRLLFSWPRVIACSSGWSRGFALSIQKARKRPGWMPSTRQLSVMRKLVADIPEAREDDPDLIEDAPP